MATRITLIYVDGSHDTWVQDGAPTADELKRWRGVGVMRVIADMAL